VTVECVSSG